MIPGQGGAGARVAVWIPASTAATRISPGGCVYGANFAGAAQPFDDHGHGTHVAGIIGARANGVGTIGVAPESTVYAVKVLAAKAPARCRGSRPASTGPSPTHATSSA